MIDIDVYTPSRLSHEVLERRHIGRGTELSLLEKNILRFCDGEAARHLYFFGPRGSGKSHLLALTEKRLRAGIEEAGVELVVLPEDIAEQNRAHRLLRRVDEFASTRWDDVEGPRRVLFFEGLDRQLRSLSVAEQRKLRAALFRDGRPTLLIATGIGLSQQLTDPEAAFFGALSVHRLDCLDDEKAEHILEAAAGENIGTRDPKWPARRRTLIDLAGGSPRTLVAMGAVSDLNPTEDASARLLKVMHLFTAHYQLNFRDLPPAGQRIVEVLAEAKGPMTPTSIARILDESPSAVSVVCNRLTGDGALRRRSEGRSTYYRLPEPLFRYWLEYRNAQWDRTRVGLLSHLLEALYEPSEMADLWFSSREGILRQAATEAIQRDQKAGDEARKKWRRALEALAFRADWDEVPGLLDRMTDLPEPWRGPLVAADVSLGVASSDFLEGLRRDARIGDDALAAALLDCRLENRTNVVSKASFVRFIKRVDAARRQGHWAFDHGAKGLLDLQLALLDWLRQSARGKRPWKLTHREKSTLARLPWIRTIFLERGSHRLDPPLLTPADILEVGLERALTDQPHLMQIAHSARSSGLFRETLAGFDGSRRVIWPNRDVAEPALAPEELCAVIAAQMQSPSAGWATTWIGSVAAASEPSFTLVADAIRHTVLSDDARVLRIASLLVLGLRAPERLQELRDRAGDATLSEELAAASKMAANLRGDDEHLHPELERFRRLIQVETDVGDKDV